MNQEMELIVYRETGHVLAVVTRSQTAGPAPGLTDYVGDGLMIRNPVNGRALLSLNADLLRVETVARREDVLLTATHFELADGIPEALVDAADEVAPASPVTLDGTNATITIPVSATALQPVDCVLFVQAVGGGDLQVQRVRFETGSASEDAPLHASSGNYGYALMVPGFQLQVGAVSVP